MNSETQVVETPGAVGTQGWPIEVRALVTSLQVQSRYLETDRRRQRRQRFECRGTLWSKDNASKVQQTIIYTRDVSNRMIAFVCAIFCKVGQSVVLDLPEASGAIQRVHGHVRRCRPLHGGWVDCVVELQRGAKVGR